MSDDINIGAITESLNNKADTDLVNTIDVASQNFKDMSIGWGIPDYENGVDISSGYICSVPCWVWVHGGHTGSNQYFYVNGVQVGHITDDIYGNGSYYSLNDAFALCDTGDIVTATGYTSLVAFPLKGVL